MSEYKIRIVVEGEDRASRPLGNAASSLQRIGEFAAGGLLARGFEKMFEGGANVAKSIAGMTIEAGNFEAKIDGINALLGGTNEDADKLAALITDLGIDPHLKVTSDEAAASVEMLVRNGLNLEQVMGGATRSTILLANATGADFATAANIATDSMAMFGVAAEDTGDVVNQIVGVVTNSKLSVNDYGFALAQAGGVAAASGVSLEDFNTLVGLSASYFSSGSDLGTSYKVMLQRLIPASEDAAATMRKLGLFTGATDKQFDKIQGKIGATQKKIEQLDPTSANYSKRLAELQGQLKTLQSQLVAGNSAFFDQNGNIEDAATIADALRKSLSGLSDQERLSALSTMFGTDAMRFAAAMIGYTDEQVTAYQKTLLSTDAETAAARRMDNLSGDMEIFSGIVETVRVQIGEKFQPATRKFVQSLTMLGNAVTPSLIAGAEGVANLLQPYADALAQYVSDAIAAATNYSVDFGPIAGSIAGMVEAAGGAVEVTADVVDVKWGDDLEYSFDVAANVHNLIWGDDLDVTFDADARVVNVKKGDDVSYSLELDAQVGHVEWGELTYEFDAKANVVNKLAWGDVFNFDRNLQFTTTEFNWGDVFLFSQTDNELGLNVTKLGWTDVFTFAREEHLTFTTSRFTIGDILEVNTNNQIDAPLNISSVRIGKFELDSTLTWEDVFGGDGQGLQFDGNTITGLKIGKLELTESLTWEDVFGDASWGPQFQDNLLQGWTWPEFTWPEWPEFTWPEFPQITWPNLPEFTWPAMPTFTWPSLPAWHWPPLPSWHWPSIPSPGWLSALSGGGGGGGNDEYTVDDYLNNRAIGDASWRGGLVKVHRDEVLSLPRGTRIFNPSEAGGLALAGAGLQIGTVVINNEMDMAEFERRIERVLYRRR